jgi:hypothetical protein
MIVSDKIELYPSLSEVTKTFYDDKRISLPWRSVINVYALSIELHQYVK